MTVLDVYVNDRKRCRAGVGPDGVLTAIVNWVKLTGPAARTARRLKQPLEESRLHVGGLADDTHRTWIDQNLKIGDRVTVVVAAARSFDRPSKTKPRLTPKAAAARPETTFLNVDLDIWSKSPLDSLVKALGRRVFALYVGRRGRRYVAHVEVAAAGSFSADRLIQILVGLVERLPRSQRSVWDSASRREFNIGIQSASEPTSYELHLDPSTVRAAARVNATIGVTVYGVIVRPQTARPLRTARALARTGTARDRTGR